MANIHDETALLRENLADAGCDRRFSDKVLGCLAGGQTHCALVLLRQHKQTLLQALHADERRIDSLDHLIYKLQHDLKG